VVQATGFALRMPLRVIRRCIVFVPKEYRVAIELRRPSFAGPIHLFAQGAVSAVMQGEVIIVTFKDGRVAEYKLSASGNAVIQTRNI
jgi:hypothetical protein